MTFMIPCDICSGSAHGRIGNKNLCRTCAHAAIDEGAPAAVSTDATDDDTLDALRYLAMTRKAPALTREIRSMVKRPIVRVAQALAKLERDGLAVRDARRRGWSASPAAMEAFA